MAARLYCDQQKEWIWIASKFFISPVQGSSELYWGVKTSGVDPWDLVECSRKVEKVKWMHRCANTQYALYSSVFMHFCTSLYCYTALVCQWSGLVCWCTTLVCWCTALVHWCTAVVCWCTTVVRWCSDLQKKVDFRERWLRPQLDPGRPGHSFRNLNQFQICTRSRL